MTSVKENPGIGYVPANSVPAIVKFCWIQAPIQFCTVKPVEMLAMVVVKMRP